PALEAHALLQRLEGRSSARVEAHDLAVEDRTVRAESRRERTQLGIAPCHFDAVAARERECAALDARDGADAVPFELEAPALIVARQRRHELREHGYERPGKGAVSHAPMVGLLAGDPCYRSALGRPPSCTATAAGGRLHPVAARLHPRTRAPAQS